MSTASTYTHQNANSSTLAVMLGGRRPVAAGPGRNDSLIIAGSYGPVTRESLVASHDRYGTTRS
ncbi:hypothetical protein Aau02nite_45760 [Amorphoplanes auranticolor]|uniref:Uncharacterized protein n=1 Tax=Actinoplanes auranticolor TaxID=47988 RepID=A0A919SI06_9ACTN|nr:hypothetical protein Aau02nite_45760 [Actinoplanes auranticolor]